MLRVVHTYSIKCVEKKFVYGGTFAPKRTYLQSIIHDIDYILGLFQFYNSLGHEMPRSEDFFIMIKVCAPQPQI